MERHKCVICDNWHRTGFACQQESERSLKCGFCIITCPSIRAFRRHLQSHYCEDCERYLSANETCECFNDFIGLDNLPNIDSPKDDLLNLDDCSLISTISVHDSAALSDISDGEFVPVELESKKIRLKTCRYCELSFRNVAEYLQHCYEYHRDIFDGFNIAQIGAGVEDVSTPAYTVHNVKAIQDIYQDFKAIYNEPENISVDLAFAQFRDRILEIGNEILKKSVFKFQISIELQFSKYSAEEGTVYCYPAFHSVMYSVFSQEMFNYCLIEAKMEFLNRIDEFTNLGSGWVFDTVKSFQFKSAKYYPLQGGNNIILPECLQKKNCLINVPASNNECFKNAIRAHHLIDGKITRRRKRILENPEFYKKRGKLLNWDGIQFPINMQGILKFEKQNPEIGLSIITYNEETEFPFFTERSNSTPNNVDESIESVIRESTSSTDSANYSSRYNRQNYEKSCARQKKIRANCLPYYVCREPRPILIDLLLVDFQQKSHYCLIDNLTAFLKVANSDTKHICRYCLQGVSVDIDDHMSYCMQQKVQKTKFPEDPILKFQNFSAMEMIPFAIFADFESFINPNDEPSTSNSECVKLAKHTPSGFNWTCVDHRGKIVRKRTYHAENESDKLGQLFLKDILSLAEFLNKKVSYYESCAQAQMQLPDNLPDPLECFFCSQNFKQGDQIVRHHTHLPPYKFKGYAHNICNVGVSVIKCYPVFFHNFAGYDSQYIIQSLDKEFVSNVEIIPQTEEKFMSVKINQRIKFVDSMLFLQAGLEKVAKSMNPCEDFTITRSIFREYGPVKTELLLEKGIFPYQYMTGPAVFSETRLPDIQFFYDDLNEEPLKIIDYEKAQRIWTELGIRNLGHYQDNYVERDVGILADAMYKLRKVMWNAHNLDIFHYLSLPHFCLDAALKITKVKLDHVRDPTMHLWFESSIRGGYVSCGNLRAATANNPLCEFFNPNEPLSYIIYWDMNNLYSGALQGMLPVGNYRWVDRDALDLIQPNREKFLKSLDRNSLVGYFFEIDLSFPENVHEKLNSYPPAPYNRVVKKEELSPFQKQILNDIEISSQYFKQNRLISDLYTRKNYICHFSVLKTFMDLGCKVDIIHRAVYFTQQPWLSSYIQFNTVKRQACNNMIEKSFWKLANNCIYGKFIENKRKRQRIVLISSVEKAMMYNKKPSVQGMKIINENLVSLRLRKLVVHFDRPLAIGCTILDESKRLMLNFHYDYVCQRYGINANLLATDTDSLIYQIFTDNVYEDCLRNVNIFDMSNYDTTNPFFSHYNSNANKLVVGKMKDELANHIVTHFVIAKPKMYAIRYIDPLKQCTKVIKKAKGVQKSCVSKKIKFDDYVNAISENMQMSTIGKSIRSINHQIYTLNAKKKAINGFDIKRFILDDGVRTLAYGHKDTYLYN